MADGYDEMLNCTQWLWWKDFKQPRLRDGSYKGWNDPANWMTFEEAYDVASENDGFLSFILSDSDPFVIIDLDNCLGGARMPVMKDKELQSFFTRFQNTLWEYSQSQTGIHVFLKGDLPKSQYNNGNGQEIYKANKQICMTFDTHRPQDMHTPILHDQKLIDDFLKTYFRKQHIVKKFKQRTKDAFPDEYILKRIKMPDTGDASKDDFILMRSILKYGSTFDQTVRIMEQTPLVRDKWERHNYLEMMYEKLTSQ